MDHAAVVRALQDPACYPHPVTAVELVQTHISSVLLTGERVYKIKKPVDFGFLDFSTLELRERFCAAEVRLNRRLVPDVYLGVEPITLEDGRIRVGGAGEVVEWAVVMRQLDRSRLGPEVQRRGELTTEHVDAVVEALVPFYRAAATGAGVDEHGTVSAIRFNTDENFTQTEPYVGQAIARARFDEVRAYTDGFLDGHAELLARRVTEGRIRDSHGDLHLGNIFFLERPVIFDCIEFNDRFRCGDIAVDLAFLAMDLDFHDEPALARRLIERYAAGAGDHELVQLMDFYCCYRAWVRGKIACFTAGDPSLSARAREEQLDLARRYFGLAHRYAGGRSRGRLVVLFGLMGTGKTALGRHLRDQHGFNLISTDAVRKELAGIPADQRMYVPYNQGLYSPEMNQRTYAEVCRRAEAQLAGGFDVAVDGCFKSESERAPVLAMAARAGAQLLLVRTECELEEQRRRLERRQLTETRTDGRAELLEDQRRDFEPVSQPHAVIHTDGEKADTRAHLDRLLREAPHDAPVPARR